MATDAQNPCVANGCSACCHDTEMTLTEDDIARLEARGHRRDDFVWQDPDGFLLLRNVDAADGTRHCTFLRSGLCSVYGDRPQGCRTYPFVLDADARRMIRDPDCPHRAAFVTPPGARRKLDVLWRKTARESEARGARLHGGR